MDSAGLPYPDDVEGGNGPEQPFERERANLLEVGHVLDAGGDPLGDQDLAAFGLAAEPRGQVRDRPDGAVVPAALEADGADRGVPLGDAQSEGEIVASLPPADGQVIHAPSHRDRKSTRLNSSHT